MHSRTSQGARELRDLEGSASEDDEFDDTQHRENNGGPSRKRKHRMSEMNLEEVFEKQDPKEKARLGRGYRELQVEADDMRANLANITAVEITQKLQKQQRLFENVRDTSIATLDAKLMATTTDTAMGLARKMKVEGNAFNVDEFLIRVKGLLGIDRTILEDESSDEDELDDSLSDGGEQRVRNRRNARKGQLGDWENVGWMAAKLYRRVPGVEFMYGPVKAEPTKRTAARRRQRKELAPEIRPEEIQTQKKDKNKKVDMLANVKSIALILKNIAPENEGINFFRLVVDPNDYGQTVENCFYVSFLIRDGMAAISVKPDGEIMISARQPHDPDVDEAVDRNQGVIELDVDSWKEAKRVFNITKGLIPHREYTDIAPMAADSWYS